MDRPTTRKDADSRIMRIDLLEAYVPTSRKSVLDLAEAALSLGPILMTGDAGVGKSWIIDQLTHRVHTSRWTQIDLTPADGPSEFYRHIARGLGLVSSTALPPSRLEIADALTDFSADGERQSLVIDEAHNLSPDVWEEVRVLANRLGRTDGFAHLVFVGQTALVRRFSTRPLAAIEARLAAHVHLRPFDLDEARDWLTRIQPGAHWSPDEVEAIHRDSGGNPSRLLRRLAAITSRLTPMVEGKSTAGSGATLPLTMESDLDDFGPKAMIATPASGSPPLTGVDRPPLMVDENAIEVGWSAEEVDSSEFVDDGEESEDGSSVGLTPHLESTDQAVHDHYAALQAWREWADNQDRRLHPPKTDRDLADEIDEAAEAEAAEVSESIANDRSSVRVEGHQHFAPFGQLFTRMPHIGEPKSPRA